jgi:hypothetical protein
MSIILDLKSLRACLLVVLVAAPSRADTAACARVLERARDLRAAGKVKDALAEMNACTECPALADVCEQTRASMGAALPTLSVTARACGGEALAAIVTVDGDVASSVVTLEPGRHDVRATLGGRVEEQTVYVAEGEHKHVSLVLADVSRPTPLGVWVLGAASASALLTAGTLWGVWASLPDGATFGAPIAVGRNPPVVDETRHDFGAAAAVALAVSVTTLVTAIVVYLTRPFPHPKGPD